MIEKIGPYRVYERLGVGGMGEVYKAYDDRLDRWVAIKRIRPDREDAEDNRERFKREARATARLNHPSIVHLYGIFQEDESDCIVMEYVEGKSLDSIVSEQPLDPLRVASLGHEIASGLAEAHSNGILHRDLKAENIIITNRGRAKILDFGLAKPILRDELDPILTGKGQLVGTSRAMSPEYVSGEAVDHRSDLFSLGVLLYECLTGHSPFKAHNTLATLKQVMLHKQPSIVELDSKVPQELSDLIDRLLAKSPDDRPQSAHEVALEFGRLTGQISSGAVERPTSGGYLKASSTMTPFTASDTVLDLRPRRRWVTVATVIAVLLILAFFFGRRFRDQPPAADPTLEPDRQISIVLGDFGNQTDEALLGDTVGEAFRASLGQSRLNTVLSHSQIRGALARMQRPPDAVVDRETGVEICLREGAERLIMGQISKLGNTYSLTAEVVNPQDDTTTYSAKESAQGKDEILGAIDRLSQELRRNLGESLEQIEETTRPLEKVTTPNLEALRAYTLGIEKIAEAKADEEAIKFFYRALALDSGFAMAHAKLAVLYSNINNRDKALEHLDQALAKEDRLSEVEKFYVDGWAAIWRGTPDDVIRVWSLMSDLYPQVFAAHRNLGLSHWLFNLEIQQATSAFARAGGVAQGIEIDQYSLVKGYCSLILGDEVEAREFFESVESDDGIKSLIDYHIASRHTDDSLDLEIAKLNDELDRSYYRAFVQLSRGDFEASLKDFDIVLEGSPPTERPGDLISALLGKFASLDQLERFEESRQVITLALGHSETLLQTQGLRTEHSPLTALALMAKTEARRGRVEIAKEIEATIQDAYGKAQPIRVWQAHLQLLRGEILRAEGDSDAAQQEFISALATVPDLFQARESLAISSAAQEDWTTAWGHLEWLMNHRGRAIGECHQVCFSKESSITLQTLTYFEAARILQHQQEFEDASRLYSAFLSTWHAAEESHPAVSQALAELERMGIKSEAVRN